MVCVHVRVCLCMCMCARVHACFFTEAITDYQVSLPFQSSFLEMGLSLDLNHLQFLCLHMFSRPQCGSSTAHEAMVDEQAPGSQLLCSHCPELFNTGVPDVCTLLFLTRVWESEVRFSCPLSKHWSPLSHLPLHGRNSEFGISPGDM